LKVAKGEITRPTKKLRLLESAVIDGVPPSSGEDVADSNQRQNLSVNKPQYDELIIVVCLEAIPYQRTSRYRLEATRYI
ncbi:hypothetical protein T03_2920, partial [Trichinella britovi]